MNNDLKVGQSDLLILTFMPVNPDIKQEFIMIRIQNIDKLDFIRKNLISHVITKKIFCQRQKFNAENISKDTYRNLTKSTLIVIHTSLELNQN